jgi:2-hydroxychromene-2-carboxylate isomerase
MSGQVEFFFDFMSPYSYLASTRVEAMVSAAGGSVSWRPCFLPAILKATDNRGPGQIPAKLPWLLKDLADWADLLGLPPVKIPDAFPFLATQANRCALVAVDEGKGPAFCVAMFAAIWRDGLDPNDPVLLGDVLSQVGLDAERVLPLAASQPLKDRLKADSEDAVRRGAFGVPTFFIGEEMFVGNDRLDFVVRRLKAR